MDNFLADWKYKSISECVENLRSGIAIAPTDFTEIEEIKVAHKGDVTYEGILNLDGRQSRYVKEKVKKHNPQSFVTSDYLVVSLRDLVPNTPQLGLINKIPLDNELILAQGTYGFKANEKLIVSEFLCLISTTTEYRKLIRIVAVGSTQKHMRSSEFFKLKIPVPSIIEQKDICEKLSHISKNIASTEKLITKKQNIKQATMQQLLTGKTRLPGFSGEWSDTKLGTCLLSRPKYGINAASVTQSDNLPTYIRITDIGEDGTFLKTNRTSVDSTYSKDYFLEENDLVFARTGASVGKSYLYQKIDGRIVFAGFLIKVRPDTQLLDPYFLFSFTKTAKYNTWVKLMSMRSGQPGINGQEFAQMPILLPSLKEQKAIAHIIFELSNEISQLKSKLQKLKNLKQGMMQELLTGRIRLV